MAGYPQQLQNYKKLFDKAVWPVWIADLIDQKIIWANDATLKVFGVNPETLLGSTLENVLYLRGADKTKQTIRNNVEVESHFTAYFNPYKTLPVIHDDIIDNNRAFVQPIISDDFIVLYLRPGKSPLLNTVFAGLDRFIMRLDEFSNVEELLPTAYWNKIVQEGSFFQKNVTELIKPECWNRYCIWRSEFIQMSNEYVALNKTPFVTIADNLLSSLDSKQSEPHNGVVYYFKQTFDLSGKDYKLKCTLSGIPGVEFGIYFDQRLGCRYSGFQFGFVVIDGINVWTLKKNSYHVKIVPLQTPVDDFVTIDIVRIGKVITIDINEAQIMQFVDESEYVGDQYVFGISPFYSEKFISLSLSARKCSIKKENLDNQHNIIELNHLPERAFKIEVFYVELWDKAGIPLIREAFIIKDVTDLKVAEYERNIFKNKYNAFKKQDYHGFIFKNVEVGNIIDQLENFADSKATILIQGPTGTGKGVLAKAIHNSSSRKNGPLIRVDCASIPQSLMERELFGNEKGAYTGAFSQIPGKFELADKGTLFLDEIGNIDLATQTKLLGFLEDQTFCRLGGTTPIKIDVRIIAATNADLPLMMRYKTFREDLYYRLRVFDIKLPALKERKDDIPLLVDYFVKEINRSYKLNIAGIASETMEALMAHDWPGNVRELYNHVLNLALNIKQGAISGAHVPLLTADNSKSKRVFIPDNIRHEAIVDLAKKNGFISARECMKVLKVSLPTIKRDLKILIDNGSLVKRGKGPAVRYFHIVK